MIFVTVGTQKYQFDRLLKKIDELIEQSVIDEDVFAQIGASRYKPQHYAYKTFMPRDIQNKHLESSDIVITHAGTGIIMHALRMGKKVIAVPRLMQYGEHVDDHQTEIVEKLGSEGIIEGVLELDRLGEAIKRAETTEYRPYISTRAEVAAKLIEWIDEYI